jgi:hypothetical protein
MSLSMVTAGGVFTTEIRRHKLITEALESGDVNVLNEAIDAVNSGSAGDGYELIARDVKHNIIPNEGLNDMLDVWINGGSQVLSRYVALFSSDSTPATTWTSANFHGTNCTEWEGYNEAARQLWDVGAVSSQSVDNSASKAVFTSTSTATLYGAAILSASAKDGTSDAAGTLYAATRFSASRSVVATDVINIQYTLSAVSS